MDSGEDQGYLNTWGVRGLSRDNMSSGPDEYGQQVGQGSRERREMVVSKFTYQWCAACQHISGVLDSCNYNLLVGNLMLPERGGVGCWTGH